MECEDWIMGNPDTNVANQSSESRLAGYYSFAGTDFVSRISAVIWPPSTRSSVAIPLLF